MIEIRDAGGAVYRLQGPLTVSEASAEPPKLWKAEFFNNAALAGPVVATAQYDAINFDWKDGKPVPQVGADLFSARFVADITFPSGAREFIVTSDDGFHLFVDDVLLIGKWMEQAPTTYHAHLNLSAGVHRIRLEYFEQYGGAVLKFSHRPYVAPPPAPSPVSKPVLGVNCINDGKLGDMALDAGAMSLSATFNPDYAAQVKQRFPSMPVASRGMLAKGYLPTVDQWWGQTWQAAAADGMTLIGINENDQGIGTSPEDIRKRIAFDREALAKVKTEAKARGKTLYYAGGGFSVGEPNIMDDGVVEAMYGYAELMEDPLFRFNQHLYASDDHGPGVSPTQIRDLAFDESFGDMPTRRYRGNGVWENVTIRVYRVDWTMRRYAWYYQRCGWRPDAPGRIVSDECGLDIGSIGGFAAMQGCDDEYMTRWARAFIRIHSMPIIVNGREYPSPLLWANIFQTGDRIAWGGYDLYGKYAGLSACKWGQA